MGLFETLKQIDGTERAVKVGIVGLGQMGEGLACQMETLYGMEAVAIADIIPGKAAQVYKAARVDPSVVVETDSLKAARKAAADNKRIATTNTDLLTRIPEIDIIVEVTGIPEIGVQIAHDAIISGKHVVQMNVEADATVGFYLQKLAESAGVVYTLTGGDEPGTIADLYDFAVSLGFDVVSVGKGANNPLDRSATPESIADVAKKRKMNPKMLASFYDGSKTMVEMTSIGNGIGFVPDVPGMHGPGSTPETLHTIFIPKEHGGVLNGSKAVEFSHGVAPGVFLVFTAEHPKIIRDLEYLKMGEGPYYSLFRPYHLTSLETPITIARAALYGETTLATTNPPVCETVAYAKKDLKKGDSVDSIGGFTVYGMIEKKTTSDAGKLLPLGLAPGARIIRDVPAGTPLSYGDVEMDENSHIRIIRRLQDNLIGRITKETG